MNETSLTKRCTGCELIKPVAEFGQLHGRARQRCKACLSLAARQQRAAKPELYKAALRKWQAANRDYFPAWKKKNPDKVREANKKAYPKWKARQTPESLAAMREKYRPVRAAYKEANKEKLSSYRKSYNERNADFMQTIRRNWTLKNRDKVRETENRHRARKNNAPVVEKIDRQAIIDRDKSTCYLCDKVLTLKQVTLDHVIPLSRNGNHTASNLRVACHPCNARKGNRF